MGIPGPTELIIILVIVLLIFGGGKIAGVGKSLGTAISEFKDAVGGKEKDPNKVHTASQVKSVGVAQADKAPLAEDTPVASAGEGTEADIVSSRQV